MNNLKLTLIIISFFLGYLTYKYFGPSSLRAGFIWAVLMVLIVYLIREDMEKFCVKLDTNNTKKGI